MIFKDPWILFLIPVALAFIYFIKKRRISSNIEFSSKELMGVPAPTMRLRAMRNIVFVRGLAVALVFIALARPQSVSEETKIYSEGIDIALAIDSSGSMLAEDFTVNGRRKNRLVAVKMAVEDFIRRRKSDRIAIVAFAGRAYTVCPLTLDYNWLIKNLERVKIGSIEDGTAIGSALASSLARLKDTEAESKVIILLTDGINNAGKIPPLRAAEAAKAMGVKIYTIGAGTKGLAPYPVRGRRGRLFYQNMKIPIDDTALKEIARKTGGMYFRATDTESLKEIYTEIDKLEKTKVEETGFRKFEELFSGALIFALALLLLEVILKNTILRKLP
ncbi:MAG: VWA domain-containing protein [Omnitrophica bacterium]|nr:VWA domain-containing protein [Candidatus Omnitrophota bacterium]